MNLDFTLSGVSELQGKLDTWEREVAAVVARALNESAESTMGKSKDQYVPVDTGTLRSSGTVQTTINGREIQTTLSYGGAAQRYAIFVHEINKNYHGGRSWKYLETPLKQAIDGYNTNIAEAIKAMMEGG